MTLSYIVSGFAVGLLVGMTGVGGGSLMTPLLTLLFGVPPSVAVGTDLAFASITKSAGTLTHRLRDTIRWDIVKRLCIGALPAAVVSTLALKSFGTLSPEIGQIIRYSIAALGHWWLGSIHWELLASLLVGSLPGITLGSWVARSVPEKFLRVLLAMTLTGVAVKLIY